MIEYLCAKLHGVRVTEVRLDYPGSITLSRDLMAAVDLVEFQRVHVVNLTTGARWSTYVIADDTHTGWFELNGGGARLGCLGDECVIMAFAFGGAGDEVSIVHCDETNHISNRRVVGVER